VNVYFYLLGIAERRIVCYYTNWSVYRPGTAKFSPQNINPYLCTHLIYAFGGFTKENALKPFDKYQDIEKGGYAKFTGLKTYNKNLKTMLAIGGWNEGSSRFSPMVADPARRREFIKNSVKFLRQNHFDGLDLDWEYPAFRDGGKPRDKDNYADLVQELRKEFERESSKTGRSRLLLSMAMPAGVEYIDKGYDVPRLNEYLDFINLLSYDYHSAYEPAVNHHSPLYPLEEDNEYNYDAELTIDYTITHLLEKGASADKVVLGIPTYGRSYTLFNQDATELGSPADGPGTEGEATREKGYLAYYYVFLLIYLKLKIKHLFFKICESIADSDEWEVVQPNPKAMGPYAFKGNQWVGYDDEDIVKLKAHYVNEKKLGGIMFWSIDNDDFRGKCHGRPYPLIEAAKEALLTDNSRNTIDKTKSVDSRKKTRTQNTQSSTRKSNISNRRSSTTSAPIISKRVSSSRPKYRTISQASKEEQEDREVSRRSYDPSSDEDTEGRNTVRVTEKIERPKSQNRSKTQSSAADRITRRKHSRRKGQNKTENEESISNKLTTPEPPTTPDPGTDFKCEDEGFFPHPRDCKKYFWCLDSGPGGLGVVAHQFTCPSGLVFNKGADSCDYPRNVICPKTSKTSIVSTTRSPITAATSRTTYLHSTTTAKVESEEPLVYKTLTRNRPSTTTTTTTTSKPSEPERVDSEDEEDPRVIKELIDLIKKAGKSITKESLSENEDINEDEEDNTDVASSEGKSISNPLEDSLFTQRVTPSYVNIRRTRPSITTSKIENDVEGKEIEIEEEKPTRRRRPIVSLVIIIFRQHDNEASSETSKSFRNRDSGFRKSEKREDKSTNQSADKDNDSSTTKTRYSNIQRFRSTTLKTSEGLSSIIPLSKISETTSPTKLEEYPEVFRKTVSTTASLSTTPATTTSTSTEVITTISVEPPENPSNVSSRADIDSTTDSMKLVEDSATEILFTTLPAISSSSSQSTTTTTTTLASRSTIAAVSQPRPFGFTRRRSGSLEATTTATTPLSRSKVSITPRHHTRPSNPVLGRVRLRTKPVKRVTEEELVDQVDIPHAETSTSRSKDLSRSYGRGSSRYTPPTSRSKTQDVSANFVPSLRYRERGRTTASTTVGTVTIDDVKRRYRRPSRVNNPESITVNELDDSPIVRITQGGSRKNPLYQSRSDEENNKITNIRIFRKPTVNRELYDRTKYTRKRNNVEESLQKVNNDLNQKHIASMTLKAFKTGTSAETDRIEGNDLLNGVDQSTAKIDSVVESNTIQPIYDLKPITQIDGTTISSNKVNASNQSKDTVATTTTRIEIHEFNPDLVTIVSTERVFDVAEKTSGTPRKRKIFLRKRPISSSTVVNIIETEEEETSQGPRRRKVIKRKRPLQNTSTSMEVSLEEEEDSSLLLKSTTPMGSDEDVEKSTVSINQTEVTLISQNTEESTIVTDADEIQRSTIEMDTEVTIESTLATATTYNTESMFLEDTLIPSTEAENLSTTRVQTTLSTSDSDSATTRTQVTTTPFTTESDSFSAARSSSDSRYARKKFIRKNPVSSSGNTNNQYIPALSSTENSSLEILSKRKNYLFIGRYPVSSSTVNILYDDLKYKEEKEGEEKENTSRSRDLARQDIVNSGTTLRNKSILTNGFSDDTAEFWKHYTTTSLRGQINYPSAYIEDVEDRKVARTEFIENNTYRLTPIVTRGPEIRPRYKVPIILKRPFDPEEALSPRRYPPIDSAPEESEETPETRDARLRQSGFRQPRMRYKLLNRNNVKIEEKTTQPSPESTSTWQYFRTRSYPKRTSTSTEAAVTETLIPMKKFDYVADAFHRKQQSLRTTTLRSNDFFDSQNLIDPYYTRTTVKPSVTRLVTSVTESGTTERQKILIKTKYSSLTSTTRIPADQFPPTTPLSTLMTGVNDDSANEVRHGVERSTLPIEGEFNYRHNDRFTTESYESSTIEIESVADSEAIRLPTLKELIGYPTTYYDDRTATTSSSVLLHLLRNDVDNDISRQNVEELLRGTDESQDGEKKIAQSPRDIIEETGDLWLQQASENRARSRTLRKDDVTNFDERVSVTNTIQEDETKRKTSTNSIYLKPTTMRGISLVSLISSPVMRGFYITRSENVSSILMDSSTPLYTTTDIPVEQQTETILISDVSMTDGTVTVAYNDQIESGPNILDDNVNISNDKATLSTQGDENSSTPIITQTPSTPFSITTLITNKTTVAVEKSTAFTTPFATTDEFAINSTIQTTTDTYESDFVQTISEENEFTAPEIKVSEETISKITENQKQNQTILELNTTNYQFSQKTAKRRVLNRTNNWLGSPTTPQRTNEYPRRQVTLHRRRSQRPATHISSSKAIEKNRERRIIQKRIRINSKAFNNTIRSDQDTVDVQNITDYTNDQVKNMRRRKVVLKKRVKEEMNTILPTEETTVFLQTPTIIGNETLQTYYENENIKEKQEVILKQSEESLSTTKNISTNSSSANESFPDNIQNNLYVPKDFSKLENPKNKPKSEEKNLIEGERVDFDSINTNLRDNFPKSSYSDKNLSDKRITRRRMRVVLKNVRSKIEEKNSTIEEINVNPDFANKNFQNNFLNNQNISQNFSNEEKTRRKMRVKLKRIKSKSEEEETKTEKAGTEDDFTNESLQGTFSNNFYSAKNFPVEYRTRRRMRVVLKSVKPKTEEKNPTVEEITVEPDSINENLQGTFSNNFRNAKNLPIEYRTRRMRVVLKSVKLKKDSQVLNTLHFLSNLHMGDNLPDKKKMMKHSKSEEKEAMIKQPEDTESQTTRTSVPVEKDTDRFSLEVMNGKSINRNSESGHSNRRRKPTPFTTIAPLTNTLSNTVYRRRRPVETTISSRIDFVDAFEGTESYVKPAAVLHDQNADVSDQSIRAQEFAVTLSDPPSSTSDIGQTPLRDVDRRKISTTVIPRTDPTTSRTVSRYDTNFRSRQRSQTKDRATVNATTRPRRPPVIDYDYYEDEAPIVIGKSVLNSKLFLTSKGTIRCMDQGNFPHPYSCKKFITCARMVNGQVIGTEYTCPDKLSFDPVGGICNWSAGLGCKD
ncbi:Chitotriosidase-1, partial [Trachymyrmex cornetzi]